ncbi:MAG: 2Fe-2S iron-sulfur cluster binding domain-containing protein, partial [Myxococcales bacterium]|nr:2Fe-2S iron-sulfur cluster binding domain-containing protein [Myxococcales bacterium]
PATTEPGAPVAVRLTRTARTISADGAGTLLEQLERGGARPASGCRMGICKTCTCRKRSGVVENLLTGARSTDPDEDIQLCVSVARSELELEL